MKTIYFAALMFVSSAVLAQSNFEGVITMNTTNEAMKEKATVTWYLKGNSSRLDINSQAGEHDTQYAVISDAKGMDLVSQGHVTPIQSVAPVTKSSLRLESETQGVSVNGFTCTKQVYADTEGETTYWLAKDLELGFDDLPAFIRRNMPAVTSNGFPVRMEKRDGTGKLVLSQDVLSVHATSVDASKFERK